MEEAVLADKIFVMDSGKIAMEGTPREVFSHVEEMDALRLEVPVATALAHGLRKKGYHIREDILMRYTEAGGIAAKSSDEIYSTCDVVFQMLFHIIDCCTNAGKPLHRPSLLSLMGSLYLAKKQSSCHFLFRSVHAAWCSVPDTTSSGNSVGRSAHLWCQAPFLPHQSGYHQVISCVVRPFNLF